MYGQSEACETRNETQSSLREGATLGSPRKRIVVYEKPRPAWIQTARFLSQASVGGALGGYAFAIGIALYSYQNGYNFLMIILFPVFLVEGAVLGLLTGVLTLLLENLIEERLWLLPRLLVTSIIATLFVVGLQAFENAVTWQLVKASILPGAALGFPVGLVARSKFWLGRALVRGISHWPNSEAFEGLGAARDCGSGSLLSLLGGLALRLVSSTGLIVSVMVLACCWNVQSRAEVLVTVFAIYYFGCTAFVSFGTPRRWVSIAAGSFLNALLLIVALEWSPVTGDEGSNPMTIVFSVLTFLWILFIGGHLRPASRRQALARSRVGS